MILKNRLGGGGAQQGMLHRLKNRAKASLLLCPQQQNGHADAVLDLTGGVAEK